MEKEEEVTRESSEINNRHSRTIQCVDGLMPTLFGRTLQDTAHLALIGSERRVGRQGGLALCMKAKIIVRL